MSRLFRWLLRGIAENAWWSWLFGLPGWAYLVTALTVVATAMLALLEQLPLAVLMTLALGALAFTLFAIQAGRKLLTGLGNRPLKIDLLSGRVFRDPHLIVELDLRLENCDVHPSWIKTASFEVIRTHGRWRSPSVVQMPRIEAPLFAELAVAVASTPVTVADFLIFPSGFEVRGRKFADYRLRMHCIDESYETHIRDDDYLRVRLTIMGQPDEVWEFSVARWPRKWHAECPLKKR